MALHVRESGAPARGAATTEVMRTAFFRRRLPLFARPSSRLAARLAAGLLLAGSGDAASQEAAGRCPEPLEILVERAWAADAGTSVGDTLRLSARPDGSGCPASVAGLFLPEADPAELTRERPRVLLHLPDLIELADRDGSVDRFTLRLAPDADRTAVAAELGALLPGTRVLPSEEVAARASTTFEVVRRFHRAIGLITITAGGVFLACIMTLKVQERRAQVAALRLVGISRRTLLAWLMTEAAIVSGLGGVLGIGLGHLASAAINGWYQRAYDTTLVFSLVTPGTVGLGLALAVALGVAAGLVASLRLLAVDPLAEAGR